MPYADRQVQRRHQAEHGRKKAEFRRTLKEFPCSDCGIQYPYYVMDFDHVREKAFQLSHSGSRSEQTVLAEASKCDVVCANCHRERTHARLAQQIEQKATNF